ncbi:hypothetical protein D3C81_1557580 [compost metagenome]
MEHAVDQRGRHGLHDGAVLRSVPCANDDGASGEDVFPDAFFEDQTVKSLLHLMRTRIQFIKEQTVGLGSGNDAGGTEPAGSINNLRDPDEVFRG